MKIKRKFQRFEWKTMKINGISKKFNGNYWKSMKNNGNQKGFNRIPPEINDNT